MLKLVSNNNHITFDPLKPDAYLNRLAMAAGVYGIRAREDIYSAKGVLLIAKNSLLSPELIAAIFPHKLKKPLESSISFESEIDLKRLQHDFMSVMRQDDLLTSLNEHQNIVALIKMFIESYEQFPGLMQKISVMAVAMPDLYRRTLYCTWFSLIIAKEMRFSDRGCTDIFLAALAHDIGMLHINPSVLEKETPLTPEDWRHIQSHVHIGKHLLKKMPEMPEEVIEAVFEHHERCDGTGYPLGRVESELSYAGKIIGLADSIIAIYHNRFKNQQRNWRDVIPVVQMNAVGYFYRHDEILGTIWRRSEMPFKNVVSGDELPQFIEELLQTNGRLQMWFTILRESLFSVGFTHGDRQLHSVQNIMIYLTTSIKGSGVFDEKTLEWLRNVDVLADKDAYRHIEKAYVQQHEIVFHLQRLNRMIGLYLDAGNFQRMEIKNILKKALEEARQYM